MCFFSSSGISLVYLRARITSNIHSGIRVFDAKVLVVKKFEAEELERKDQCFVKIRITSEFLETISKGSSPWRQLVVICFDKPTKLQCLPKTICVHLFDRKYGLSLAMAKLYGGQYIAVFSLSVDGFLCIVEITQR
jgi:hypothetical protein